ncbi:MAG TPA: ABC transporter permease, partial [Actinospica sp.]|nr:ABC transporter permease [Actinospica sp.]
SVEGLSTVPGYTSAYDVFGGTFSPWNIQTAVIWWLGATAVATVLLRRTRAGNWVLGTGGDPVAARMVGVPVDRVKVSLFVATSVCAALVGIMVATRLASVTATQGVGDEFMYIVCAVVGGTLLGGGYGSPAGASLGAVIIGMAFIGIQFSGWDTDWRFLFLGVILLAAVLVNNVTRRAAERRRR